MPSSRLLISLILLLSATPAWAKLDYSVRVDAPSGLAGLLQDNLELVTSRLEEEMDETLLTELVRSTPEDARKLLETEGYFDARVNVREESPRQYVIEVKPGQPTLIDDVTIRLNGPIRDEGDFQQRFAAVLEAWSLPMGAPYRQSDWDGSKRAVMRLITADRFPRAQISKSAAEIDPATRRAQLVVDIDSGPVILFGDITVKGMKRYPEKIATGLADFSPGTAYRLQKIFDYQSALEQAPHFSNVVVSADMAHIDPDTHRVPVEVDVTEMPRQKLELGLIYDSGDGPGVRVGYDHYNIFRRGYTGSLVTNWKKNQQSLSLGLGFPRQSDGYSHSITSAFKTDDVQGLKTRSSDVGGWRTRTRGNIEARLGLQYLLESEEAGGVSNKDTRALQLVYGWTQRAVDDLMRPRSGVLLDFQLSGTVGSALSSTSYVRGYARTVGYWSPFPKYGTFVGRLELGQVWANDKDAVPSSILFRAGGANSVRGYDYQSLGLPGPNGSVLGGRVVATGSLEYQIPIKPDWYLALFTDAGNASQSWKGFQVERANGVGVRWMSPVAPLAFDFAKAERDGKIRWNLSLGLAF